MREDEKTRLLIMLGVLREGIEGVIREAYFHKPRRILLAAYEGFMTAMTARKINMPQ